MRKCAHQISGEPKIEPCIIGHRSPKIFVNEQVSLGSINGMCKNRPKNSRSMYMECKRRMLNELDNVIG